MPAGELRRPGASRPASDLRSGFRETVNGFRDTANGKKANESIDCFPESIDCFPESAHPPKAQTLCQEPSAAPASQAKALGTAAIGPEGAEIR